VAALVLAAALGAAADARAADPGRWTVTGTTTLPLVYYQGVTIDAARSLYFDGVFVGLYRTTRAFAETGRNNDVIPPDVHLHEGYNHVGDIAWDPREGGRILLPLECYVPNGPNGGNPCLHGSIGVAGPGSLHWRYYVKLDPAEIPKAMWNEVSPDGSLLWTSSGDDLLAYRTADISRANAAPENAPVRSVRRLRDAVPPSGITGATFVGERLFVAGQGGGPFRVWSIDLATGRRRLEIERRIVGESEGLVTAALEGGTLHWLIQPFTAEQGPPTYSPDRATLLSFRSAGGGGPAPAVPRAGAGSGRAGSPLVYLLRRSRATVSRRNGFAAAVLCPDGCTAALRVLGGRRVLARSTKRAQPSRRRSARSLIRLTRAGRQVLRTHAGRLRLTLRADVREPAGRVTRRTARVRLR
jgi:hypothetical protein